MGGELSKAMHLKTFEQNGRVIALIDSDQPLITDAASALGLLADVRYETGADRIALNRQALSESFFILSTCLAGEVLQKFINYHAKLAVYGDFSEYTSKPLRDFIRESNRGNDIFSPPPLTKLLNGSQACNETTVQKQEDLICR